MYTLYNVSWELDDRGITSPLCVKTAGNVLRKEKLIYKTLQYPEGSKEGNTSKNLDRAIRVNSWKSKGDAERAVVIVEFNSKHILEPRGSGVSHDTSVSIPLMIPIPNTTFLCRGEIYGKIGKQQILVRIRGCGEMMTPGHVISDDIKSEMFKRNETMANTYTSEVFNFMYLSGTAAVFLDAKYVKSKTWSAHVATLPGMVIYDFARDVIDKPDTAKLQAFTAFLSDGEQDFESINKYPVAFKHCNAYRLQQPPDEVRQQDFSKVKEEQKVTVVVYE